MRPCFVSSAIRLASPQHLHKSVFHWLLLHFYRNSCIFCSSSWTFDSCIDNLQGMALAWWMFGMILTSTLWIRFSPSQFVSQLGWRFVEAQVIMTGCWCTAGMLLQYDVFIFHTIHDGSGVFSTNSTAQQPDLRLRCKQTLVYTGAIKLSHFGVIVSCHHACWVPLWGSASWKFTQTLVVLKFGSHKLGDGTTCWWVWSPTYVSCTS